MKPKFTQLPLLPDTPGMETPGVRARRRPMSPGERELEEALLIRDPETRLRNVARIEQRNIDFKNAWYQWQQTHQHEVFDAETRKPTIVFDGCVRCDGKLTDACLLYQGKAYCAQCRNEVWGDMGKRVGLYL